MDRRGGQGYWCTGAELRQLREGTPTGDEPVVCMLGWEDKISWASIFMSPLLVAAPPLGVALVTPLGPGEHVMGQSQLVAAAPSDVSYIRVAKAFDGEGCVDPFPNPHDQPQLPPRTSTSPVPLTVMWWMSLTPVADPSSAVGIQSRQLFRAALLTARRYAPLLEPHLLYLSTPDELSSWALSMGVTVYHRNLSFFHLLPLSMRGQPTAASFANYGAYGRLDVASLVGKLRAAGKLSANVHPDLLLYTDFDIVFTADPTPHLLALPPPAAYYGVSDYWGDGINSGVMFMNVSGMMRLRGPLLKYAQQRSFKFGLFDQTLLNNYCEKMGNCLPRLRLPTSYNERTSVPTSCATISSLNAKHKLRKEEHAAQANQCKRQPSFIWHWHGKKPGNARCLLERLTKLEALAAPNSVADRAEQLQRDARQACGDTTMDSPIFTRRKHARCELTRLAGLLRFWETWALQQVNATNELWNDGLAWARGTKKSGEQKLPVNVPLPTPRSMIGLHACSGVTHADCPLRIGIISTAGISQSVIVEPCRKKPRLAVVAGIAARDEWRARAWRKEHAPEATVFSNYDALFRSESIDAVYVPLPTALHAEQAIRALERGKHVLVEKPFAANGAQAARMIEAARSRGLLLMEGMCVPPQPHRITVTASLPAGRSAEG